MMVTIFRLGVPEFSTLASASSLLGHLHDTWIWNESLCRWYLYQSLPIFTIPTCEMSLTSYIAHLRRVVKATVTLLMLSLLSSPCPSEEHGRCEACSTKAQKVRSEGLGLSHSDPAQNTEPFRTSKTKQSPTMQTPETGTKSSHQWGLVTSDFNEKNVESPKQPCEY